MSRPSAALLLSMLLLPTAAAAQPGPGSLDSEAALALLEKVRLYSEGERPSDPPARLEELGPRRTSPGRRIQHRGFTSVQVNVDGAGLNIMDDAANEPSIAVDPTDSSRMAIGWRQFDSITSSFREAGWGFSSDGGATWTAGEIDSGVFRSDPVLDADASGGFYYNSLTTPSGSLRCEVFRSDDGGASWGAAIDAFGGDKQWMAIDRTGGLGSGHIYTNWNQAFSCCGPTGFTRSTDGGDSYEAPIDLPQLPAFATVAVAPGGEVFVAGARGLDEVVVLRSTTLRDPALPAAFDGFSTLDLGGSATVLTGPNPGGLLGQIWVATDPTRPSNVYVLASLDPPGPDPLDVFFARSEDGGLTWSAPVRVVSDSASAWQWFGTLSVAPNGRLDAVWNDTRDDPGGFDSKLFYASSEDAGATWSAAEELTPAFDPLLGFPVQNKIGDYYDMVSENERVHVAYSATFNGEQDVYYLEIPIDSILFADGFENGLSAWSSSQP